MATVTAARAAASFPVTAYAGAGVLQAAVGSYTLATNLAAATIIEMCKLPAGAMVLFGHVRGEDLDTGTEELDFDLGWAANGGTTTPDSADPDGFGNFGTITGDAITDWKPEVSIFLPINGTLKSGPVTFTRETMVQLVINTDSATGGTGVITVVICYIMPGGAS
jgi:hypothetical protein